MSQPFQSQPLPRSTRQSQLGAAVLHKLKSPDQPTPNYSDRISDRVVDKKSKRQGTSKSKTAEASSSQGSPSTKGRPLWGKFRAAQQKSSNKNAEASSPGAGASGLNSSQGEGVDGDTSYDPLDILSQERAQSSSQDATTGPRGDQDEEEDSSGDDMLPDPVSIAVKGNWLPSPQGATAQSDVLNQADSSVELMSMAHAHAADAEHPASSARPPPRIFSQQSSGMIPMKRVSDSIRNPRKAPTRALSKTSSSSSNPDRPGSSQISDRSLPSIPSLPVAAAKRFSLAHKPSQDSSDGGLPPPIDLGWLPDQTARAPTAASTASRKVSTKMQGKRRGDCVSSTPATASPSLATPRVSPSIGTAPSGEAIIKITSSAVGAARAPRSATPKRKREHSEKASRQSAAKQVPSSSARGKGKPNLRSATATPAKAETLAQSSKDVKGKRRAPTIDESEAEEEDEDIDEDFEVSGTADPSMTQDPLLSRGISTPPCPFCDQALPRHPSARLLRMIDVLKQSPNVRPRPSYLNPQGLYVPFAECSKVCNRHREESEVVPKGKEHGWPAEGHIDFEDLPRRISAFEKQLRGVIKGKTPSRFREMAKQEFEEKGRMRMQSLAVQFGTFDVELPGYYGPIGYEVMVEHLTQLFGSRNSSCKLEPDNIQPLDQETYIRRVLLPESALRLIMEDRGCEADEAMACLEDSRAYGVAVHSPLDDLG